MKELIKLNLGCGYDYREGYINIDMYDNEYLKKDLKFDCNNIPMPFAFNSVKEVLMYDFIEHLENPVRFLEELFRISADSCIWKILAPYITNTWQEMFFHKTFRFHENSFNKFEMNTSRPYYSNVRLLRKNIRLIAKGFQKWIPLKPVFKHFLNNIYSKIYYEFEVIK